MSATSVLFYLYAGVAVAGAVGLVTARRLIHGTLALFATLFATGALFLLLGSEFLAALQLFVYGGAITVLILFALMLTADIPASQQSHIGRTRLVGGAAGIGLLIAIVVAASAVAWPSVTARGSSTDALAHALFTRYAVPFEVAGLVLTVALLGAIVLSRSPEDEDPPPAGDTAYAVHPQERS